MSSERLSSVDAARADPVLKRYLPRRTTVSVGGRSLALVLPNSGDLIRSGAWAGEGPDEPPYWQEIWPASIAAARTLTRLRCRPGTRVLDLGCGLGLPGMAAAMAGCDVTFADLQTDALSFVRWNLAILAPGAKAEFLRIDWSRDVVGGQFDMLILSDVSYRPVHHLALWRHIESCLDTDGVVLHCDPERREASGFVAALQQRLHTVETRSRVLVGTRQSMIRVCLARRNQDSGNWPADLL